MNIKKIKSRSESLDKILKIVESKKNITLINILKLSKQIAFYNERANQSSQLVQDLAKEYAIDNSLIHGTNIISTNKFLNLFKQSKHKADKTIWVYVTETEEYDTNSYSKHEKNILANANKNDLFIAIGSSAINFCKQNEFEIIFEKDQNDIEVLSKLLPNFIEKYLSIHGYFNVKFVINSSKIKDAYINVIPMNKLNLNLNLKKTKKKQKSI
ncbi:MSC_0622 family F1-like ATPase gamma subunit [Mycoplasma nasistruthionis]|uniref:Uncharacterized protein n=1 Tax=Mycoplasma nasistruthionis TaxID=353852 RepID=A0A5B7XXT4_9MOLU|nr:hypothetical protein [Mycoplasma nasistruthionis]QCZ36733.1 hypothetical protein FG904_01770 [Mycoplasma nasistruthionis]